jgi:guanine nucleotide-binding protein subunit beta-2-like 1 protein
MLRGALEGHEGWVTCIATSPGLANKLLSGSRDSKLILWELTAESLTHLGAPQRTFAGHADSVQDLAVASSGEYALSGSRDSTLRLWDLETGAVYKEFVGHELDVTSVDLSRDCRIILSCSSDKSVRVWNTRAECKWSLPMAQGASCVRFAFSGKKPIFSPDKTTTLDDIRMVIGGLDGEICVWNLSTGMLAFHLRGHKGSVTRVAVSPDCATCASGGQDGTVRLWNLLDGKQIHVFEAQTVISALAFGPDGHLLCAAAEKSSLIWHVETLALVAELRVTAVGHAETPQCLCVAWAPDGSTLYAGYTDHVIRVWTISELGRSKR